MMKSLFLALILAVILPCSALALGEMLPDDPRQLRSSISVEEMRALVEAAGEADHVEVTLAGESPEGRPIPLVHIRPAGGEGWWRVLLIGIQHGDEPAGRMALAHLIRDLARDPELLPGHVDIWILPEINPDGVAAGERRNAVGIDLNRDHLELAATETRIMHQVARRLRPHVTIDAHEYSRDTQSWMRAGMIRPLIMMDTANHPLYPPTLYRSGLDWVQAAGESVRAAGHTYSRYFVGGPPPQNEQRFSTLEADDARNGLGAYGGLSFIIESGVFRRHEDPDADLGDRVDAYLRIFWRFLEDEERARRDRAVVEAARRSRLPSSIAVNSFWGNAEWQEHNLYVIDSMTDLFGPVPTRTFMQDRITKRSVPTPRGYVISGAHAGRFRALLDAHGVLYREIAEGDEVILQVEPCTLLSMEHFSDDVYVRFSGRQIVEIGAAETRTFGEGTLVIPIDQEFPWKVAIVLEPAMLYGLYQFEAYADLAVEGGELPVLRLAPER